MILAGRMRRRNTICCIDGNVCENANVVNMGSYSSLAPVAIGRHRTPSLGSLTTLVTDPGRWGRRTWPEGLAARACVRRTAGASLGDRTAGCVDGCPDRRA